MRLWHEELIQKLSRQRLLGQHRECCALRGNGWGKKHATVDYVFGHSPALLFAYHKKVMMEMQKRGYKVDNQWLYPYYRGKALGVCEPYFKTLEAEQTDGTIYPEHDEVYLNECIALLNSKGEKQEEIGK